MSAKATTQRTRSLRHVRLESGHVLRTFDTGRTRDGRTCIGYVFEDPAGRVLFEGDDFRPSPLHADDSDETLRALLGFLLLRPDDTDREYFEGYTPAQLAFAVSDTCELLQFIYSDDPSVVGSENEGTFEDVDDGIDLDYERSYGPHAARAKRAAEGGAS